MSLNAWCRVYPRHSRTKQNQRHIFSEVPQRSEDKVGEGGFAGRLWPIRCLPGKIPGMAARQSPRLIRLVLEDSVGGQEHRQVRDPLGLLQLTSFP